MTQGHIYLIDDDDEVRDSLCALLRMAGYHVSTWQDAASFLDELPNHAPSVVITDMAMPGMSGLELHEALLEKRRQLPVIYISGDSTLPQAIGAMKLNPQDFLIKPFGREQLLTAVAAAIERDRVTVQSVIDKARLDESLRHLSPRERQVFDLLVQGFNNNEIVNALKISLPTAKQYKSEVMRKIGARSISELIALSKKTTVGSQIATP